MRGDELKCIPANDCRRSVEPAAKSRHPEAFPHIRPGFRDLQGPLPVNHGTCASGKAFPFPTKSTLSNPRMRLEQTLDDSHEYHEHDASGFRSNSAAHGVRRGAGTDGSTRGGSSRASRRFQLSHAPSSVTATLNVQAAPFLEVAQFSHASEVVAIGQGCRQITEFGGSVRCLLRASAGPSCSRSAGGSNKCPCRLPARPHP